MIHNETGFKVDVFVLTRDPMLQEEMRRRERYVVDDASGIEAWFATAEDTVLQKLAWYRRSGESSERQWNDVVGILKLGVADLVERAMVDAAR